MGLAIVAVSLGLAFFLPGYDTLPALVGILIAGVFVIETLSSIIQITSKRLFGRKVFISAPLHHHLEANGWPETKVTMRLWVIGAVFAILGLVFALFGRG